jgi:hypothetical protein
MTLDIPPEGVVKMRQYYVVCSDSLKTGHWLHDMILKDRYMQFYNTHLRVQGKKCYLFIQIKSSENIEEFFQVTN